MLSILLLFVLEEPRSVALELVLEWFQLDSLHSARIPIVFALKSKSSKVGKISVFEGLGYKKLHNALTRLYQFHTNTNTIVGMLISVWHVLILACLVLIPAWSILDLVYQK